MEKMAPHTGSWVAMAGGGVLSEHCIIKNDLVASRSAPTRQVESKLAEEVAWGRDSESSSRTPISPQ
jgi:hypothetical protein